MNWARVKKKEKYILLLLYAVYAVVNNCFLHIGCVWRYFLGIPCIGCGFTRAMIAMIRGNFAEAFRLHPMFWSIFLLIPYFLFEGDVFKNRKLNAVVGYGVLAGFVLVWLYRMYCLIAYGAYM